METHSWRQKQKTKNAFTLLSWEGLSTPLSSLAWESGSWNTPRCKHSGGDWENDLSHYTGNRSCRQPCDIWADVSLANTPLSGGAESPWGVGARKFCCSGPQRRVLPASTLRTPDLRYRPSGRPGSVKGGWPARICLSRRLNILVFLVRTDNAGLVLQSRPSSPELW